MNRKKRELELGSMWIDKYGNLIKLVGYTAIPVKTWKDV